MAYCTITDVNGLISQQPFTAQSIPTQSVVEGFIADIATEMDATLRNLGYTVPVAQGGTAAEFAQTVILLRNANKWGAAGLAQDSRVSAVVRDDMVAGGKNPWTLRYEGWKKALLDPKNPYELPGAQRSNYAVVKPLGQIESSTVDSLHDDFTYVTNPPFSIGMKL